jgi:MFS family permease
MSGLPASLRSLRNRNYRLFVMGQSLSLIGTWTQMTALNWLVYRLTGQAAMLGLMTFCSLIPMFVLAPVGGLLADRVPGSRILVVTQGVAMVLALVLALLTLTHQARLWHLFTCALLLGASNAFDSPARQVFVGKAVPRADLMNAVALNSSMMTTASIAGPALAGILVASIGEGWCFLLNGASYVPVLAGLLAMRFPPEARAAIPSRPPSQLGRLLEGFAMVRRTPPIRSLLLLLGLSILLGIPHSVLMPLFADQVFHGTSRTLGLLMSATGAGALAGAVTLACRPHAGGLGRGVAAASVGFGLALAGFAFSRSLLCAIPLLMLAGFAFMVQIAATNTLIQMMVPGPFRGRVMAIYAMLFGAMTPLGGLASGLLAHRLGAPLTVALGGAGCVACGCVFILNYGAWRDGARGMLLAAGSPDNEKEAPLRNGGFLRP